MNCRGDDDIDAKRSRPSIGKTREGPRDPRARVFGGAPISGSQQGQQPQRLHRDGASLYAKNRPHTWLHPNASQIGQIPLAPRAVAVGTEITLRPPHRSRRALLTHRAPALDGDEEPLLWPRMQDAWGRQGPASHRLHSPPRKSTPLAGTRHRAMPTFDHVMAEC